MTTLTVTNVIWIGKNAQELDLKAKQRQQRLTIKIRKGNLMLDDEVMKLP